MQIVVAIDVESSFMLYSSGIYYGDDRGSDPQNLNHAVLIVGCKFSPS